MSVLSGPRINRPRWVSYFCLVEGFRQAYVCGICLEALMGEERRVNLFRNGRNQAVRIPVEFELPGDEAIMHRDGDRLVI